MGDPAKGARRKCFVIAPIGDPGTRVRTRSDQLLRHLIRPVCEQTGFLAERADEVEKPGQISRYVIHELIAADLVIADLSGRNPNVFYELGIRHFTGKPVVQIIGENEHLPFDVHDYRTIRVNHRDPDKMDQARKTLFSFVKNADEHQENPVVDIALASGLFLKSMLPLGSLSLVNRFEELSQTLLRELRRTLEDRSEIFGALFPVDTTSIAVSTRPDDGVSGAWQSNHGPVRLLLHGGHVFGEYTYADTYDADAKVGRIVGKLLNNIVVFRWEWKTSPLCGVGYWEVGEHRLVGRWCYDHEGPDYETIVRHLDLITRFPDREEVHWILNR